MVKLMLRQHSDIIDKLTERVKSYYNTFNSNRIFSIYSMVDLESVNEFGGVGAWLQTYNHILSSFGHAIGKIEVVSVVMDVHLEEKKSLYNGRDYAVGKTECNTAQGKKIFNEEWVLNRKGIWVNCNIVPKEIGSEDKA